MYRDMLIMYLILLCAHAYMATQELHVTHLFV